MNDMIQGEIRRALHGLQTVRDDLEAELAIAMDKVAELRAGIARIDKVIKASENSDSNSRGNKPGPKPKGNMGKPTKGKDIKGTPLTLERSGTILQLMKDNPEMKDWVASEIHKATGIGLSGINVALTYMRQENMIRATRVTQGGGHAYAPYPE
jgi:hypothetical protein